MSLAEKCRAVYGVEIVEAAIEDAKHNAELNELDNLRFEVGNAEDWMAKWKEKGIRPNVIMVDPPRKGLTESLIESATGMNPDRIVCVSCNPATLVRDIQSLMEKGYHCRGQDSAGRPVPANGACGDSMFIVQTSTKLSIM